MPANIHTLLKNAHNLNASSRGTIKHKMRSGGVFEIAFANFNGTPLLHACGQSFEGGNECPVITVRLFQ